MAAVRVHHKNCSSVIPVKEGDKISAIKKLALIRFDLQGHEGRLSVRDSGFELLDDEVIEGVPGVTVNLLREAAGAAAQSSQQSSALSRAFPETPQAQLMSLDESQFEVLRDPSVLGPCFAGNPNSPQGLAYRLTRQRKFQALLRADFAGNVDRGKLEKRIAKILTNMQTGRGLEASVTEEEDDYTKYIQSSEDLTVVIDLQLQAPCFYSSFRPLLSSMEMQEGVERPESGRILVGFDESCRGLCSLLTRKLSAAPDQMVIRSAKRPDPYRWDEQDLEETLLVQRLGRGWVVIDVERRERVRLEVDFCWSLGEFQWTIRRLVPQLRKVDFAVLVGDQNLLSLGNGLTTPLGHVYLGIAPLTVKVLLDYGGRPMPPSRCTLVPSMEDDEDALEGPPDALEISRVPDFVHFLRLQNQAFQMGLDRSWYSLATLRREMASRADTVVDRSEEFVPPSRSQGLGQGHLFLRLPARALFYVQVEVKEMDRGCVHVLPWVLPNMKLKAFQEMLADVSSVCPEEQTLFFLGRNLSAVSSEVSLQSLGIRKGTEMEMQRCFRVDLREAVSGAVQSVRVPGNLRTLVQLRLLLQSRLGVDADVLRLELAGRRLPLDGDLRALGIMSGSLLDWRQPLRVTFRLGDGLRDDLILFPDDPMRRVVEFAKAKRCPEARELPMEADDLEVWPFGSSVRKRIKNEDESLEHNGLTEDFQVLYRSERRR